MRYGRRRPSIGSWLRLATKVADFSLEDLQPYLGCGRQPVIEEVYLKVVPGIKDRDKVEEVAWAQRSEGASGGDR